MRVELLYWEGCPSHTKALEELKEAMADVGRDPSEVVVREVATDAEAGAERFVGSPTVRIDGVDIQPPGQEPVGLTCRVYRRRDGRFSPTPDPADLRDALRQAREETDARAEGRTEGKTGEQTTGKAKETDEERKR